MRARGPWEALDSEEDRWLQGDRHGSARFDSPCGHRGVGSGLVKMTAMVLEVQTEHTPESLAFSVREERGVVLLRSGLGGTPCGRFSYLAANPFLAVHVWGSRCRIWSRGLHTTWFGDPWRVLDCLVSRYELGSESAGSGIPLGGCFGFWGYDLKDVRASRLRFGAERDLDLPDAVVHFHGTLVVFDHEARRTYLVLTGITGDGSRSRACADRQRAWWDRRLSSSPRLSAGLEPGVRRRWVVDPGMDCRLYVERVLRAQRYIRSGHIYQVNLARRLSAEGRLSAWELYRRLAGVSPSPFAAYFDAGTFQVVSSSPEMFLRFEDDLVCTRPIKGTRPRGRTPGEDLALAKELQSSPKERAELLMITDLMRNDLGKVCEFGTVSVPELYRLERFAQVQHLVSTVTGSLRSEVSHVAALAACFPGGSITGAPKLRAMEIIEELEPVTRGPYTGCLGYIGFNRQSQLSILIRTALVMSFRTFFHTGAGIVADSDPEAEYAETEAKAAGFLAALGSEAAWARGECPTVPERGPR